MKDCPSEFCTCRDVENDPNFIACDAYMKTQYIACIDDCPPGDHVCLAICNREYEENLKDCPCQENCREGCPCENYSCGITTTTTALSSTTTITTSTTAATTQLRALKSQ